MFFVFVLAGLALLVITGLYARRRLSGALAHLGVRPRRIRIVRWVIAWLLFGYPLLLLGSIVTSLVLGRTTLLRFDGLVAMWALVAPFMWATLVVFQAAPWLVAVDVVRAILTRRGVPFAARAHAITVLVVIGAFAIYTPARVLLDFGDLRVRHHQVGAGPSTAAPFRIAFLADIQQDEQTDAAHAREVFATINAMNPDLVLSGGDWINTGPEHIDAAAEAAGELRSRLGTFSVRGDHEHFAYFDRERSVREVETALGRHGVTMLDDEVRWFEHGGKRIAVVFLGNHYIRRAPAETITALVDRVASADFAIVVSHQLDAALVDRLADKVDLVLGAHTHGGQVNPVVGVTHVPLARLETPYIDGRYQRGTTTIIVTAGVGNSIVPFRYAAPGSIELVELRL